MSEQFKEQLREQLAAYAHEAWSGWMRYLFSKCVDHSGEVVMPQVSVERWKRQMVTQYQDLPEEEKASDRDEADKILSLLSGVAEANSQNLQTELRASFDAGFQAGLREGKKGNV